MLIFLFKAFVYSSVGIPCAAVELLFEIKLVKQIFLYKLSSFNHNFSNWSLILHIVLHLIHKILLNGACRVVSMLSKMHWSYHWEYVLSSSAFYSLLPEMFLPFFIIKRNSLYCWICTPWTFLSELLSSKLSVSSVCNRISDSTTVGSHTTCWVCSQRQTPFMVK